MKGRVLFVFIAIAVLGLLAWALHSSVPDPLYNGKPLSYWLQGYAGGRYMNSPSQEEANAAVREIGTNAVPLLLQLLRANDPPLKAKFIAWTSSHHIPGIHFTSSKYLNIQALMGFQVLGRNGKAAVPELISVLNQDVSQAMKGNAAEALGSIGADASPAVPVLLWAAASTNSSIHDRVVVALAQIHADPDEVVPILIKELQNPRSSYRSFVADSLGRYFGASAKSAVPTLVELLNDPKLNANSAFDANTGKRFDLRPDIEFALRKIDPETYAQVVTNKGPASK